MSFCNSSASGCNWVYKQTCRRRTRLYVLTEEHFPKKTRCGEKKHSISREPKHRNSTCSRESLLSHFFSSHVNLFLNTLFQFVCWKDSIKSNRKTNLKTTVKEIDFHHTSIKCIFFIFSAVLNATLKSSH